MLPPLQLQVAPGAAPDIAQEIEAGTAVADGVGANIPASNMTLKRYAPWLLLLIAMIGAYAWWRSRALPSVAAARLAKSPPPAASAPGLAAALKQDDLAVIAQALCADAGLHGDNLGAARSMLHDAAQLEAVELLQAARWGGGDAASALAALRRAFAKGAHWRKAEARPKPLLAPLYPE